MVARGRESARIITVIPQIVSRQLTLSYSDIFSDHLANPRNAGELADADVVAEETNPVCGDRLRLSLRIRDGRIDAARFLAYGCPPTLACGSAIAEMIQGTTIHEATKLTKNEIVAAVGGLPSRKQHAASLAIETLRAAIIKHASEDGE
ncbi:MAG: iron-sulfur cluster assembly scaffold protein [Acidobacteria bacterium]|nr:MAG: iron-sulfur cluster assembly scaffold protein [Acidobacteriota bacterium]